MKAARLHLAIAAASWLAFFGLLSAIIADVFR
jgi:hypothetical protein